MTNGSFRETERRHPRLSGEGKPVPETRTRRPNAVHAFGSDEERRGMDFDVAPMDFGNRVPRLVPRGAPIAPIRDRPIGLKDTDAPRPWTLRRVFGLLFLPRR